MSKFSNTPLCTIDVLALKPSRFLLPEELQLPYRDEAGLVNVELLRRSMEQVSSGTVACPDSVKSTLAKWTKHAEAWLASTSAETTTWLRGDDSVWRCGSEERRGLEPSHWDILKGGAAVPTPTTASAAKSARREPSPATSNKRPAHAATPAPLPMAGLLQSPPPAVAGEAPDFKVEYAKSGRSSCKRCKEGIEKDELRFSRCVQSPHFDGKMDTWHHMDCFFDAKWAPKSHTEIVGVGTLRPADQRLIKQRAPASASSAGGPAAIDGDMQAEYAASGRAVCRHCGEKIDKGEPRAAYPGASESRPGMIVPKWHHLGCFFESESARPFWQGRSVSDFVGASSLSKAHRAELSAGLGGSAATGEKRKGGGGGGGGDGDGASGAEHESSEAKKARVEAAQAALEARLEKQAGSEWAVIDNLNKTLEPKELKAMLAANGAPTGGGEAAVEQRCVDGLLYGRMGPCPECGGDLGLASDGSAYRCTGDFSDFTKCTHRTQAPPRKPWIIPPQLLSSVPWLAKHDAKYKHKPRTKLFAAPLAPRATAAAPSSGDCATLPSKSTLQKSQYAAKETSMTIKVLGLGAVHEASGLQERGVVLQEKGRVYSETMSLADVASDTNSYYVLQVIHERGPEEFKGQNRHHVFRKWGRVGTTIGGQKLERMSKRDAIAEFERLFLDKTGFEFAQRDAMRADPTAFKRAGKFLPVQLDHGADGDSLLELAANAGDGSALPRPTQQLVRTLFDVKLMRKLLLEFEVDTQKLPLGKLSQAQLAAAYSVLTQLHAALSEAAPVERLVLVDLSNQFYTLLPSLAPAVLDTADKVRQKIELVDALRQLEVATSLLRSPRAERLQQRSVDELDAHYAKLRCDLTLLEAGGAEHAMVMSYLANTHAPTHREYRLELEHAWRVEREGDAERFAPFAADTNRQLLWHGSRTTNFAGILSQGLRIAPKEAPVTGYMFGKGVYFADMSSKSANYCAAKRGQPTGHLLLAEVALGGVHERTRAEFIEPSRDLPPGKASVKGLGKTAPDPAAAVTTESGALVPLGAPKPSGVEDTALLYNEYIVYDPSRIAFRYLLQVKFVFE